MTLSRAYHGKAASTFLILVDLMPIPAILIMSIGQGSFATLA
jgi:hypothetical protein